MLCGDQEGRLECEVWEGRMNEGAACGGKGRVLDGARRGYGEDPAGPLYVVTLTVRLDAFKEETSEGPVTALKYRRMLLQSSTLVAAEFDSGRVKGPGTGWGREGAEGWPKGEKGHRVWEEVRIYRLPRLSHV